jgi:apolipoprotein N-acyltransferase
MVHAALSGVSATFDAEGRQITRMGNHDTGAWVAEIPLVAGRTPYVRAGDWVPVACMLALLGAALVAGLRAARDPSGHARAAHPLRAGRPQDASLDATP